MQTPRLAGLVSGWVASAKGRELSVTLAEETALVSGELLVGSIIHQGVNAQFRCKVLDLEGTALKIDIDSRINLAETEQDSRIRATQTETLILEGEQVLVTLNDVSMNGVGFMAPVQLRQGARIELHITSAGEPIVLFGIVRFCTQEEGSIYFRTGVKLDEMDRLLRARWVTYLQRGDPIQAAPPRSA